jgi:hypothetical protein
LARLLGSFSLQGTNLQAIEAAATGTFAVSAPIKALADLAMQLHFARIPATVLLVTGLGGLDPGLVSAAEVSIGNPFAKKEVWALGLAPNLWLTAIDGSTLAVHGHTIPGSLNLAVLAQSLRFHQANG